MQPKSTLTALVVVVVLSAGQPVFAGLITGANYDEDPASTAGHAKVTVSNAVFSPPINLITKSAAVTSAGFIDVQFPIMVGPQAVYAVTDSITNAAKGMAITGLTIQLGSGVGTGFTQFPGGSNLLFDQTQPYTPGATNNFTYVLGKTQLHFTAGSIPFNTTANFGFGIDLPNTNAPRMFTMRENFTLRNDGPGLPEPGSFILLGTAMGVLVFSRRCFWAEGGSR